MPPNVDCSSQIFSSFTPKTNVDELPDENIIAALALTPTLVVLLYDRSSLVLCALDMQACRFEKLDTVNTFTKHEAAKLIERLVPIKRRIADTSQFYENAFAIFCDFIAYDPSRDGQQFSVFTVRDGRFVAICGPQELEHEMSAPTCIDDGQTLLGFAENKDGFCYECLLDAESGKQLPLKVDSSGQPIESGLYRLRWVGDMEQIQRTMEVDELFSGDPEFGWEIASALLNLWILLGKKLNRLASAYTSSIQRHLRVAFEPHMK